MKHLYSTLKYETKIKLDCIPVLPVSEVWNMGYSAPWTLLNNLISSPGW